MVTKASLIWSNVLIWEKVQVPIYVNKTEVSYQLVTIIQQDTSKDSLEHPRDDK